MNIPLAGVFEKMDSYAKFIKDLITRSRNVSFEPANNFHHFIPIASRPLVKKMKKPGEFTLHAPWEPSILQSLCVI